LSHAVIPPVARPAHVPAELFVDFNVHNPPGALEDLHGAWHRLHAGPDIVWAPYHGGHWIFTRAEDIDFAQRNHDPFSMRDVTMPANTRPTRLLPLESDPPEHAPFRAILNPWFSPKRISELKEFTRQFAIDLIEGFKPHGECEFMQDFASILPIAIFMRLTHLPMDDRLMLLRLAQMSTRGGPQDRAEAATQMMAYLVPVIADRRANPGDDLLSTVVHAKVNGTPINDTDLMSMLLVILFGGLDTVASTMGFIAHFMANHPEHRRQLNDEPGLVDNAVEELMRRFGPSATARTLTRDYEYKGIHFKTGEKVYINPVMAGLDDRRFQNPMEVDFRRAEGTHNSFGVGPHRCPGALLAKLEIRLFLQEWLARIPDFQVKPGEPVVYGPGQFNCVERLVLTWPA
jgi:cytochrome P450